MTKITVLGGTGYAGVAIVKEAAKRNHTVTSLSRSNPTDKVDDVTYVQGSALDETKLAELVRSSDVIVGVLSPRGDMAGRVSAVYQKIAALAADNSKRFIAVGGFGSLRPAEGQPRFVESPDFPADYAAEAKEMAAYVDWLQAQAPEGVDWLYVSPASEFGAYAPGEALGHYRTGGDVAIFDNDGKSAISGTDFAKAIIDEIETPEHHRKHISFVS